MNDNAEQPDIVPGKVAIVGADGETVLNEGAKGRTPVRHTHANRRDFAQLRDVDELRNDVVELVRRINDAIPQAAIAVGDKMYEQFSGETADLLEQMEEIITRRIIEHFESRTIRGRLKRWWREHVVKPQPELVQAESVAP